MARRGSDGVLTLSHFSAKRNGAIRSMILQKLFTSDMAIARVQWFEEGQRQEGTVREVEANICGTRDGSDAYRTW